MLSSYHGVMVRWGLALLLLAACGDVSREDQCAQLYPNRDDFRAACLQCGPIPEGAECFELCPNAPQQQWCQLTGGAETCCQCRLDTGWAITVLDCQLQYRDAATDAEVPDGGPHAAPVD